jgi:EAL domain-containing protein (putative c-di-GMP-specific phosphodiesterase class I)
MLYETCTERDLKADWFQNALAENRFETWFQPVVDTSGHRIVGHECLIRVCAEPDPGAGVRGGEEIIEAARAGNHLPLFDSRAMAIAVRSAAAQFRLSQSSAESNPGVFFINMLPGLVADPAQHMRLAMEALAASRQTSGLRPQDLVFEAVDSDFAGDSARLRAVHDYVRSQGCGFALDHTGLAIRDHTASK